MYRVGFGDFFLVTVPTSAGQSHILIDCGVHAGNLGTIGTAIDDLATVTGKHLSLIVVTHRHADHISGFATYADRFAEFRVDAIWMSWWDDPSNKSATAFQAALSSFAEKAQAPLALRAAEVGRRDTEPFGQALAMLQNIIGVNAVAAVSGGPGSNDAALALLRGVPKGGPAFRSDPVRHYYKAGDEPELPSDLAAAGLQATILGPPIDPNLVAQMSSSAEQYLQVASESAATALPGPFAPQWRLKPGEAYPPAAFAPYSEADVVNMVKAVRPDALLEAARKADNTLNNQSLVILFSFGGKSLLFVGDAQWGNWENFLYGGAAGPGRDTQLLLRSRRILSTVDFYKVGHHGSTNATPIPAVEALREECAAMCSTEPGCYGSEDKGSEVPRGPLLAALQNRTGHRLVRSDQVPAGEARPTAGLPAKLPQGFSTPGQLYIDCEI